MRSLIPLRDREQASIENCAPGNRDDLGDGAFRNLVRQHSREFGWVIRV